MGRSKIKQYTLFKEILICMRTYAIRQASTLQAVPHEEESQEVNDLLSLLNITVYLS